METRHSIYKSTTGKHTGKWFLEVRCLDDDGKVVGRKVKRFGTKLEATRGRPKLEKELRADVESEGAVTRGAKMTFSDLCRVAEKGFLAPAVIRAGQVRRGVRSSSTQYLIKTLEAYFGEYRLNKITAEKITAYGLHRFDEGKVKYSSINRELTVLRQMLKHAVGEKWITTDVFGEAALRKQKLINRADDVSRERLLSDAEELILLEFCYKAERAVTFDWKRQGIEKKITKVFETGTDELTAIALLALDAGMRAGEIKLLEWSDIDFDNRVIAIRAETTKTLHARRVPITTRTAKELKKLPTYGPTGRIFDLKVFRRAWVTAVKLAGIDDLEFRDLRRTFAKRLEGLAIAFTVLQKIMGHASESITGKHYLPATIEDVQDVADKLDARNGGREMSGMPDKTEVSNLLDKSENETVTFVTLEANGLIN